MSRNIFVFVVCGSAEHIDTLHLSLRYLRKYSKHDIIVLTDSARNEIAIDHDQVIDVRTDEKYNHHQASIYLKTGIHKFLPAGNNYCYLDTDVIDLSEDCDDIFNEFIQPIRFAADHCKVRKFSAYAVSCGCSDKWKADREKFNVFIEKVNRKTVQDERLNNQAKELQFEFDELKKSFVLKLKTGIRYFSSYPKFRLNSRFYFDRKNRTWHAANGEIIMYEINIRKMQKETGLKYNRFNQTWYNKDGENIWQDECDHLVKNIYDTFGIRVKEKNWQHWNGGVFLFNDSSHDFLNAWHNKTMHIFTLPEWKTRDQGTLIATAWEFGLAKHPVLSKKWNFIADYYNNGLDLDAEKNLLTDDGFHTSYKAAFVHVYHNWAKKDWKLWQWIETKL